MGDGIQPHDLLSEFTHLWRRAWQFEFEQKRTIWRNSLAASAHVPNLNRVIKALVESHAYTQAGVGGHVELGAATLLKDIELVSHRLMENLPLRQVRICICTFLIAWIESCWIPSVVVLDVHRGHPNLKIHTKGWSPSLLCQQHGGTIRQYKVIES